MSIKDITDTAKGVSSAKKYSSVDLFRDEILSFITNQTNKIERDDELLSQVKEAISQKVELHELDIDHLIRLITVLSESGNKRIDSLFRMFTPTPNTTNPLLPPSQEAGGLDDAIDLTPDERKLLHKFQLLSEKAQQDQKDTEE